jgi:hypothetical protein
VSCSDSVFSLCQVVLLCCNGTAAWGPIQCWPSRCGGVCPILLLFNDVSCCWLDVTECLLVGARCGRIFSSAVVVYSSAAYSGVVVLRSQSNRPVSGDPR